MLGPWKRDFTAGARYSPDGRQVVFEKVHKTGRGPDSDIDAVTLSVVRLDRPAHPVRALTDPRLFAATADWSPDGKRIVYSALAEPDGDAPDLFWIRPRGGEPTRITHWPTTAATPPSRRGCRTAPACCSAAGSSRVGQPGAARACGSTAAGSARRSATTTIYGRHPRVQPAP